MSELRRDTIDAKIFLLREKHKDKETNRTEMGKGTPFQKDLADWLEEQAPSPNYTTMAVRLTESYTERHEPTVEPNKLPLYEPQAILALDIVKAVYITEAEATLGDLRDHRDVRAEAKRRHDMAHAKWDRFIQGKMSLFQSTTETWADVEKRESAGGGSQEKAA